MHPVQVGDRQAKAMRIIIGLMLMIAFVMITFGLLTRYAGSWGVPYFSYTSERGSPCTNKLTGYVCEPLSLGDVEFYTDIDLPNDSVVRSGAYTATHDYTMTAELRVPKKSQAAAWAALAEEYGSCVPNHPAPMNPAGLAQFCVLTNDDAVTRVGEPPGRLYVIGTGIRKDGTRVIAFNLRSR